MKTMFYSTSLDGPLNYTYPVCIRGPVVPIFRLPNLYPWEDAQYIRLHFILCFISKDNFAYFWISSVHYYLMDHTYAGTAHVVFVP